MVTGVAVPSGMGIYDRDYMQGGSQQSFRQSGLGRMSGWSVTTWLLAICVAVFMIDGLLAGTSAAYYRVLVQTTGGVADAVVSTPELRALEAQGVAGREVDRMGPLQAFGQFTYVSLLDGQVWRLVTFQFLHGGLGHLFGNMIGLYFFGPMIEEMLGRRRFLAFYLLCGATGPLAYLFFQFTPVLPMDPTTPLIGASAGVFGILAAATVVAPDMRVMLLIPPIPVKLKTVAFVLLGVAVFTVFTRGNNAGGEAAHLGGALLGWFLIRNARYLDWAEKLGGPQLLPKPKHHDRGRSMRMDDWR